MRRKRRRPAQKFNRKMRTKLMVLFSLILAVLCGLIGRLTYIEHTKGETYQKKVLSMQSYDSKTIPYQRGEIIDRSGTVLATSVAVYNVILDCTVVNDKEEYVDPTVEALVKCFPELDETEIRRIIKEKKDKRYIVLAKKVPYDEVQPFVELQDAVDKKGNKVNPDIKGVWFEKEYRGITVWIFSLFRDWFYFFRECRHNRTGELLQQYIKRNQWAGVRLSGFGQ